MSEFDEDGMLMVSVAMVSSISGVIFVTSVLSSEDL